MIAGCGRVGSELALRLAETGHDVSVIDDRPETLRDLGSAFNGTTHAGPAIDMDVLEEAGIEHADVFVAVTNSDNANLMAVQLAQQVFGVPKTLARLDQPNRADAYRALSIDYVAGATITANAFLERITERSFPHHLAFEGGDVDIVELVLGKGGEGITVSEMEVHESLRVAAVRRGGSTVIPGLETVLRAGDLVVAAARQGVRSRVAAYLEDG